MEKKRGKKKKTKRESKEVRPVPSERPMGKGQESREVTKKLSARKVVSRREDEKAGSSYHHAGLSTYLKKRRDVKSKGGKIVQEKKRRFPMTDVVVNELVEMAHQKTVPSDRIMMGGSLVFGLETSAISRPPCSETKWIRSCH